jgi:hypothetical protein
MPRVRIAACVALLLACPAFAQPAVPASPPEEDETVVVEGQRQNVTQLVRGTIKDAGVTALARFEDPICPGIVGLTGAQADRLVQLIREDVVALGGKVDEPGCTANATVIFTDEPVEFVKKWPRRNPAISN